jgi:AP-4 complex subunit mu-1
VRKNFTLVYELFEEIIDFGYPQLLSSEQLKPHITNTPIVLEENKLLLY